MYICLNKNTIYKNKLKAIVIASKKFASQFKISKNSIIIYNYTYLRIKKPDEYEYFIMKRINTSI